MKKRDRRLVRFTMILVLLLLPIAMVAMAADARDTASEPSSTLRGDDTIGSLPCPADLCRATRGNGPGGGVGTLPSCREVPLSIKGVGIGILPTCVCCGDDNIGSLP